ncbi:MAG: hypothetical protein A2020_06325 [Lentisphaerae bacterium GWF2_45_14]|nr:MAG: hypothetical protein A2020_06325 [Lentisphaerae bacterium GWF2_45_14]
MAAPSIKILFLGDFQSANTASWIEGFREAGAEVIAASARPEGRSGVYPLGPSGLPARLRMLLGGRDLKKLITSFNPDVIVGYRVTSYGYMTTKTSFHPVIVAAQNEQITFLREPNWLRQKILTYFARKAIKNADLLHAWSTNIAEGLEKFGADEKKILLMHRGISTDIFTASGNRVFTSKSPRIVSTRSLYPEYRLDDLIKAFAVVRSRYSGAKLSIIGDGPEKKNLMKLAESLGVAEGVSFPGKIKQVEIAVMLSESDIYISLIDTEGLSSSLLEACSCGVLPIVSDIPASREIIKNGENGILITVESPEETGNIICTAFENRQLRERCALRNPEFIQNKYDRKKNIAAFIAKYKELSKKCAE